VIDLCTFNNTISTNKKECAEAHSFLLFQFPGFNLASFFIHPQVTIVAGLFQLPCFYSLADTASRLCPVRTIVELALTQEGCKVRKGIL
jgi:hypothetical protein